MTILDHLGIAAADYETSRAFYAAVLAPLGITELMSFDTPGGPVVGFGRSKPDFWLSVGGPHAGRLHIAFSARSRAEVDAFHAAALAAGAADNGAPGPRPIYHEHYYGGFVLDPDGHNIEAVCHDPE